MPHEMHRHDGPAHGKDPIGARRSEVTRNRRRLALVAGAGVLVVLVELVAGFYGGSLVLLADATHYATDLMSVLLAYFAAGWALRPATDRKTFGYQRAEVVSAFVQAVALWIIGAAFVWQAYLRLLHPTPVDGHLVLYVGVATLAVNVVLTRILHSASRTSLNVRAAYLHLLSDVLGSLAAVVAGLLIVYQGWTFADPALTLVVTLLIGVLAWRLTSQTVHILLEGTPSHLDAADVAASLRGIDGVQDVHDLPLWTLTSGVDSLSAHVVLRQEPKDDRVVHIVRERVRKAFGIEHVTVQVESPGCPCTDGAHSWGH
jgi:cobalt-zinc-cadmium efflux system protein